MEDKARKDQREKELKENLEDDEDFNQNPFTTHMAKKCLDKDYMLDFMEKLKREKSIQLYSMDPSVLPASEVKPLKFSNKDKFTDTMEINLDMAGNTQAKGIQALEGGDADLGHWHLANSMEFIRNAHSLAKLEKLKIRDPSSSTAIKNYVESGEIITPQARKIIEEQKKLMPKFYKNSYSRRRNS
jgi:hypothetical protein